MNHLVSGCPRELRFPLLYLVFFAMNSCAGPLLPTAKPLSSTIVIFGDSTSAPRPGIPVFATILQQRLREVRIINAGVGGNSSRDAVSRLDRDVLKATPAVVTIFFGINDSAVDVWKGATQPRVSLGEYASNLLEIVRRVRAAGGRPILLTPNPVAWTPDLLKLYGKAPYQPENPDGWNILLKEYSGAVQTIAAKENVELVDVDLIFRDYAKRPGNRLCDLLVDGMHPNAAGHRLIADAVLRIVQSADSRHLPAVGQ